MYIRNPQGEQVVPQNGFRSANSQLLGMETLPPEQQTQLQIAIQQQEALRQKAQRDQLAQLAKGEAIKQGAKQLFSAAPTATPTVAPAAATTTAATPTVLGNASAMGAGPLAGIALGTALTAQGVKDAWKGETPNTTQGQAARLQTAALTGGISELLRPLGIGKPKTRQEEKDMAGLIKSGVQTHLSDPSQIVKEDRNAGQQLKDLLSADPRLGDFAGFVGDKWVNTKWLKSGDTKDLRPEDITGYSSLYKIFGNDWLNKYNENQRREIAKFAIDNNLVSPEKGQMNITDPNALMAFAQTAKGIEQANDMPKLQPLPTASAGQGDSRYADAAALIDKQKAAQMELLNKQQAIMKANILNQAKAQNNQTLYNTFVAPALNPNRPDNTPTSSRNMGSALYNALIGQPANE